MFESHRLSQYGRVLWPETKEQEPSPYFFLKRKSTPEVLFSLIKITRWCYMLQFVLWSGQNTNAHLLKSLRNVDRSVWETFVGRHTCLDNFNPLTTSHALRFRTNESIVLHRFNLRPEPTSRCCSWTQPCRELLRQSTISHRNSERTVENLEKQNNRAFTTSKGKGVHTWSVDLIVQPSSPKRIRESEVVGFG